MSDDQSITPETRDAGRPRREGDRGVAPEPPPPTPEELDARDRRMEGPRKPMGPPPSRAVVAVEDLEEALALPDVPPTEPV